MIVLRILLVLVAVALVVLAVGRAGDARACEDARRTAFGIGLGRSAPSGAAAAADALVAHCRGASSLVAGASALLRAGEIDGAARLAAEAVRRERNDATAWQALARVSAARGDTDTAARAGARVRELNPLGTPRPAQAR